jgi:aryl-alcohol dehydrogenase-like predicted oxidoreductase
MTTILPNTSRAPFAPGLEICRILNGMWQVSGAHGRIDPAVAIDDMLAYHDAGYTTWDLADHYGPAEEFIGAFRRRLASERGEAALSNVQAFTKWVPRPGPMTREVVEQAVGISLRRMDTATLDLLQFHWWDYGRPAYLEALHHLDALRAQGRIRYLGLTNFDTIRLEQITAAGIPIVSNQVQYSLVDRRPEVSMAPLCLERGVQLLTYGTLCGGFLSDAYLGQPEPQGASLQTASQRKYKQMIDAWGEWSLFQDLLRALRRIADRRNASIAAVAVKAILDRPAVAGVIAGTRLGLSEHRADNAAAFGVALDEDDWASINEVCSRSRDLFRYIGDCGDEYRR